jgi:hypothetical protein
MVEPRRDDVAVRGDGGRLPARLPPAALPGTGTAAANDFPPSIERADRRRVPDADFAVHTTVIAGIAVPRATTTRGGCWPDALASPAA